MAEDALLFIAPQMWSKDVVESVRDKGYGMMEIEMKSGMFQLEVAWNETVRDEGKTKDVSEMIGPYYERLQGCYTEWDAGKEVDEALMWMEKENILNIAVNSKEKTVGGIMFKSHTRSRLVGVVYVGMEKKRPKGVVREDMREMIKILIGAAEMMHNSLHYDTKGMEWDLHTYMILPNANDDEMVEVVKNIGFLEWMEGKFIFDDQHRCLINAKLQLGRQTLWLKSGKNKNTNEDTTRVWSLVLMVPHGMNRIYGREN